MVTRRPSPSLTTVIVIPPARELSGERIVVENTTAEIKHFKALAHPFRHAVDIYDDVMRSVVAIVNPRIVRRVMAVSAL